MVCPKCGFEQPDAPGCARCGVIVARHRARRPPAPQATAPEPLNAVVPARDRVVAAARRIGPIVLCGALFVWAYRSTFPAAPPPPSAPAAIHRPTAAPAASSVPRPAAEPPRPVAETATVAAPPPAEESFPTVTCPLVQHGFGAGTLPARVSPSWYTGDQYEQARGEQETSSAAMVVYVYTDWCPYCREFERELLSDRAVDGYLRDKVVKVRVNPETTGTARAVARQFGVEGYPSFFVVTPGGSPDKMALRDGRALKSADAFITGIESRMRQQAQALLASASAARQSRSFAQALDALNRLVRMRPDDPEVYVERGRVLAETGAAGEAFDDLARAASLRPEDAHPFAVTAEVLGREERWDEVVACWTGFLDRNPSHADGYVARASALGRRGTPGLAQTDSARACQLGRLDACRPGHAGS